MMRGESTSEQQLGSRSKAVASILVQGRGGEN